MLNCRSIPPKTWEHARQALVFYFSRRHSSWRAEDLAQETLTVILSREDYRFEKEEDFLRVCYGFAAHVLQAARREPVDVPANELGSGTADRRTGAPGLKNTEVSVYLNEVLALGREQLRESDWQLIREATLREGERRQGDGDRALANKARVKLHRARRKLAELTGWRKEGA